MCQPPEVLNASNPAKQAVRALEIFEQVATVQRSLASFIEEYSSKIGDNGVKKLNLVESVLSTVCDIGQKRIMKISHVPYLEKAYSKYKVEQKNLKRLDPCRMLRNEDSHAMKRFIRSPEDSVVRRPAKIQKKSLELLGDFHHLRRSPRARSDVSKDLKNNYDNLLKEFTGLPPDGANVWTKSNLFTYLSQLENLELKLRPFLLKIIERG